MISDQTKQQYIDKQIIALYTTRPERGAQKEFCRRFNMSRWQVRDRALALGVAQTMKRQSPWSDDEIEILEKHYFKHPDQIRKILYAKGYTRSATAISVKRKRLHLYMKDADVYTAGRLAEMFGVDGKVVTRWIEKGLLKAKRRGTNRRPSQGGDMWQITHRDVRRFIIDHVAVIDTRKVDKFWFVDILANVTR